MTTSWRNYLPGWDHLTQLSRIAFGFGLALLIIDTFFLASHLALNFGYLENRAFHLEIDGGYPEIFQYLKLFACAAITLYVATSLTSPQRAILAALLLFLLFEDAVGLHEDVYLFGERYVHLQPVGPFSVHHLWELLYGIVTGGLLVGIFIFSIFRTTDTSLRERLILILFLLLLLGAFGIFVDALHGIFQEAKTSVYLESFFGLVEDWGEMLTISVMAALILDDAYRTAFTKVLSGGPR